MDALNRLVGLIMATLVWILICSFLFFIFYKGYFAIWKYGFRSLFWSFSFQLSSGEASFWPPFGATVFLALVTVILAIPIALRCSIWISFYCPERFKKLVTSFLLILANVPSVILAVYVRNYLAPAAYRLLILQTSLNLVVASISLVCMILPLIILLFNSVLENRRRTIVSAELLGLERNYVIHRIVVRKIRHTIALAIIFVIGRVFSESIMLSTLLSSENYLQGYGSGFSGFINSQMNTVSSLIGENYFSDGSSEDIQNLMFLFGGLMLVASLMCNALCLGWIKRDKNRVDLTSRYPFWKRIRGNLTWVLLRFTSPVFAQWESGIRSTPQFIYESPTKALKAFRGTARRSLEYLSLFLFFLYGFTFFGSVIVGGLRSIFIDTGISYREGNDTLLRSICNTLVIALFSIVISAPIAFFCSFFLSEYTPNGRFKKYTLALINAASAAPSITFGIFGLFIFIQRLRWTASGETGKSLLAGILTMSLFVLPYLANLFYTHLSGVHNSYREASYVLGVSRSKTFWKIILPISLNNLLLSAVLAIGKIIGETAPLYLTAGINSAPGSLFMYQGQTLTTRIYSQLYESDLAKSERIINETSLYCLLFISAIVVLGKYSNRLFSRAFWSSQLEKLRYAIP